MVSDSIDVEPRWPLGDCAALLEYRRTATGMRTIEPHRPFGPVGHSYLSITCSITPPTRTKVRDLEDLVAYQESRDRARQILHPSDAVTVFPDIATGGRCGTCYSTERTVVIGPICPDEFHDGPRETHWRRIAIQAIAIAATLISLLALFLLTIGVLP
ncbi:hypothetical protein H7J86_26205 [Mycobacterium hackensackense]|uniref:hypothetical protein n=1 Tax=Mycobacterium hackensackense TaxID=228909 RepID=UPI002265F840|nr:hypothetical protein [Mycobacterium hackensackense]MCV7255662.1 hypothetical protein [Mycobacterium hackensackense]